MSTCMICKEPVRVDILLDELGHIFAQADRHGVESLTEQEQVVYEQRICTVHCLYEMERREQWKWCLIPTTR